MNDRPVSILITDLDNTLYDWVGLWYKSFKAMLDQLVKDSDIPEETLIKEFKTIHEKHGTSEYSFSIEELPSLRSKYGNVDLAARFDAAIRCYRSARKEAMQLYPGVLETLEAAKDKGVLLVGYTESMSFYTNSRLKKLGLDRILDYVYSPPDHELPNGKTAEEVRRYPTEYYSLRRTIARNTPPGELKPNPQILLGILNEIGATPGEAIYIGDSLMKDVLMAQRAEVKDVWAKYGVAQNRAEYDLLRKVTHWRSEDVEREKKLRSEDVRPTVTLENSLHDLHDRFDFAPFVERSDARKTLVLGAWKETVDVQQHFNDLELRIRNYAITVLAAVLGLAAYGIKENIRITMRGHATSLAAVLFIAGVIPWLAFYFMDRFWYHRLLYGAVDHGSRIENRWKNAIPEIGLTSAIRKASPLKIFGRELHTTRKIDIFYFAGTFLLLLLSVFTHFMVLPASQEPSSTQPVVSGQRAK
jgi:phosphoglycolate phosphatase-like HAD superfamily hydrolase